MALGGGGFTAQNKKLPGTYINFVSAASANAVLSDRGVAAIGIATGWGKSGEIFEVTAEDFQKKSMEIFGFAYTDDKLKGLRDLFLHTSKLYAYRLDGGGKKAENTFAAAKYSGTFGNALEIRIVQNVDDSTKFDVETYANGMLANSQTVTTAAELISNDYVDFKTSAALEASAGIPLVGGTDGGITGEAHQAFLDALEAYSFNSLGCVSDDDKVKSLYIEFCKRLRDEMGQKCQVVVHNKAADHEGVINVKNNVTDENAQAAELVYWVTGVSAGTAANASATNMKYDGEYKINAEFTQSQLEKAIESGEFTFHKVGEDIRVLTDINSLVTTSDTKGKVFKSNQTIRVIDQIANDIAVIFNNNYLGTVPNDSAGRAALWMDIVKHHTELMTMRAIRDFSDSDVTVAQGDDEKTVVVTDAVTPVNTMEKLYMTVTVS